MSDPERILQLTRAVHNVASDKIQAIKKVTGATRILSLNALIEATRAGEAGKGFAVVANEVKSISHNITAITQSLEGELSASIRDLMTLGESLVQQMRGARLADMALNMIEIIDRNLYERSCDVRWWATDSAIVRCLEQPSPSNSQYASKRMGVILDSYTVYLDLWIIDKNGRVIANGRPNRYGRAVGADVSSEEWFQNALKSKDGQQFSMADIDRVAPLNDAMTATYAAAIRENGDAEGRVLGVLGIFFDWQPQALAVVKGVRLKPEEWPQTRAVLVDRSFRIIASSDQQGVLAERLPLMVSSGNMGSYCDSDGCVIGYALTPGYETYAGMGWYGVILQKQDDKLSG